jgi:hypothetical protein
MLGEFLNHSILGKTARYWERIDLSTKVQPLLPICTLLKTCSLAAWPSDSGGLALRLHSIEAGEPDRDREVNQINAAIRHKATSAFYPAGSPPNLGSR